MDRLRRKKAERLFWGYAAGVNSSKKTAFYVSQEVILWNGTILAHSRMFAIDEEHNFLIRDAALRLI